MESVATVSTGMDWLTAGSTACAWDGAANPLNANRPSASAGAQRRGAGASSSSEGSGADVRDAAGAGASGTKYGLRTHSLTIP